MMTEPANLSPATFDSITDTPSPEDDDMDTPYTILDDPDEDDAEDAYEPQDDPSASDATNLIQAVSSGPRTASRVRRNLKIARMLMDGMSIEEVGSIMQLSRATVYRAMRTDEGVRHLVDTTTRAMASMLPRVKKNYEDLLESGDERIKLDASRDVLKNVGIAPSAAPNLTITNITQNNTVVADSRAMNILREALRPKTIIDITPKPKTK